MDLSEAIEAVKAGTLDAQENPFANTVTYGVHKFHRFHSATNHFYLSRPDLSASADVRCVAARAAGRTARRRCTTRSGSSASCTSRRRKTRWPPFAQEGGEILDLTAERARRRSSPLSRRSTARRDVSTVGDSWRWSTAESRRVRPMPLGLLIRLVVLAAAAAAAGPGLPERLRGVPPGLPERLRGVPPGLPERVRGVPQACRPRMPRRCGARTCRTSAPPRR